MKIYSIIGAITSYAGGVDLKNRIIQRFSIKEQEESSIIEIFERACRSYLKKSNQDCDLEIVSENGSKIFKSEKICFEIRKLCQVDSFLGRDYFDLSERIFDDVPLNKYYDKKEIGNRQRLAFLETALIRHKLKDKYYFYNDYEKAILVHRILSRFADEEDKIKMTSTFLIPWTICIEVKRGESIWKKLEEKKQ